VLLFGCSFHAHHIYCLIRAPEDSFTSFYCTITMLLIKSNSNSFFLLTFLYKDACITSEKLDVVVTASYNFYLVPCSLEAYNSVIYHLSIIPYAAGIFKPWNALQDVYLVLNGSGYKCTIQAVHSLYSRISLFLICSSS